MAGRSSISAANQSRCGAFVPSERIHDRRRPIGEARAVDVPADTVHLHVAVEMVTEDALEIFLRRIRVEPAVEHCRIKDDRHAVVDLAYGRDRRGGDDCAARDVQLCIVRPEADEGIGVRHRAGG